jgi:hypothetical protein
MGKIYGNTIGGVAPVNVFELELEDGTVLNGVVAEEAPEITATANDVRLGKTAILSDGVVKGQKRIPAYETTRSSRLILPNKQFSIPLEDYDLYDYTQFQCLIAKRNTSILDSVEVNRIGMSNSIYMVNSQDVLSNITKNSTTKSIDLNITNDTEDMYYIHYFTFKEE